MVICSECGYPYSDDTYTIGEREVICTNCKWKGSSTQLLQTKGDLESGVGELQELYDYLGRAIAPQIGVQAVKLGLLSKEKTTENYRRVAAILSRTTRAAFKELLSAIIEDAEENSKGDPDGHSYH